MNEMVIYAEAESLEEARAQIRSQIPEGFVLASEDIWSDGKSRRVKVVADTTEAAFAESRSKIPDNVEILDEKELTGSAQKIVTIEAFDEATAESNAKLTATQEFGDDSSVRIKNIKLINKGNTGFLGIGRKPNQYQAEIYRQSVVEITYKTKAKITAKIADNSHIAAQVQEYREKVAAQVQEYPQKAMPAAPKVEVSVLHPPSEVNQNLLELHNEASLCITSGQYTKALDICERVLRENSCFAEAWHTKGQALGNLNRHKEKIRCCDEALKIDPTFYITWSAKADALMMLDQYGEAIICCEEGLKINSSYTMLWVNKAIALACLSRFQESLEAVNEALRIDPHHRTARNVKEETLRRIGR